MTSALPRRLAAALLAGGLALSTVACGGDTSSTAAAAAAAPAGIRTVPAADAAAILADPPEDLVVLDVRTAEEFAEGHLADATMIDFYGDDFAVRIADLDRDRPYVLYCRSGNRSGETRKLMEQLGFTDVADVDGGILAWQQAGLATVTP